MKPKAGSDAVGRLSAQLGELWEDPADRARIVAAVRALDAKYDLASKLVKEPGVADILQQMAARIAEAFGTLPSVRSQRILDIACGSNTSRMPPSVRINTPFGEKRLGRSTRGYTARFEPWFCRLLLELGAYPVGIDFGNLDGEAFEHYRVDLGKAGALDFLPSRSFDAVQDSRLFGSPEFTAQFPKRADRLRVAAEVRRQEQRLLRPRGRVVHSDAQELLDRPGS